MKPDQYSSSFSVKIEEILQSISQPVFDLDFYCGLILEEKPIRDEIVRQMVTNPFIMIYYHSFYVVEKAS
jgi:hypothetical protein